MGVLVRNASLFVPGVDTSAGTVDVRMDAGVISALGSGLRASRGDQVVDADGASVLPGIWDHHVHLRALAAADLSVPAGPPDTTDAHELTRRLRGASTSTAPGEWVRAVGYHESVVGPLDRWVLDRICHVRPVRVQHATGELWVVNSAGLEALGVDTSAPPGVERDGGGRPTGRIWREDRWLAQRSGRTSDAAVVDHLAWRSRDAARLGVTGMTDATPSTSEAARWLADRAADGTVCQRLHVMTEPSATSSSGPLVTAGPVKVVLDDPSLPSLGELAETLSAAHRAGRPVAVHCVTVVQAVLTLAALEEAGSVPGDRIEHGAALPVSLLDRIAMFGVTVVTQPAMLAERADRYLAEVDAEDFDDLWRLASLVRAGVPVAAGTDAPYGPADPWRAMADARKRTSPSGVVLGEAERVGAVVALRLFMGRADAPGRARTVSVGELADVVLLTDRLRMDALDKPTTVRATFVGGSAVYWAER